MTLEASLEPLACPISYQLVSEGEYATAFPNQEYDHLVTIGLFTCKAISIYDPISNCGTLVHLDGTSTNYLEQTLEPVLKARRTDLSESEVSIVQADINPDTMRWPTIEFLADFFMRFRPRRLTLDYNYSGEYPRGVALNLRSGRLYSIDTKEYTLSQSHSNFRPSQPLRPYK